MTTKPNGNINNNHKSTIPYKLHITFLQEVDKVENKTLGTLRYFCKQLLISQKPHENNRFLIFNSSNVFNN